MMASGVELAKQCKALGNERRLEILHSLKERALSCSEPEDCSFEERCCTVNELADNIGLSAATTSHHLNELREAGLLTMQQDGTTHFYGLDTDGLRAMIDALHALMEGYDG